jgi:hypothetical protein
MATQYSNKPIVTNGLVYALDFGNQKSYVSGSIFGNNLKYSPTTSSFLRAGNPGGVNVVNNLGQFTIDGTTGSFVTLNMPSNPIAYGGVFTLMYIGKPKSGNSGYFYGAFDGGWPLFGFSSQEFDAGGYYTGRTYSGDDSLKFVTVLHSSGSYEYFINGIPYAPTGFSGGSSSPDNPPHLSGRTSTTNHFTGSLGCFLVYDRKLTADEIWQNYQILAPKYGLTVPAKSYTLDPNAYLFLSQSGITDPIITSSINTFVLGLKSASLWDKMVGIYPFVGTGSAGVNLTGSHRWNLKEPSTVTYGLTFTGSWQGSTSGSTPSGSNTNITIGQVTPKRTTQNGASTFIDQNNAHISILSYDTPTSSSMLAGTGMTREVAVSTLAGDYGTPAAAYSVRKVRTAYSGALMDVRRSIDNVTQSIGYVSNGDLDTGSLLDWVLPGRSTLPGTYSGLAAAYSLRKVSGSYTGSAIDVRRDSDNTTSSISFNAAGNLDTGALLAFVTGSANTGSGFVAQWYDQSGNNRHATQTATGSQPLIVSSGSLVTENGKPAIEFSNARATRLKSPAFTGGSVDSSFSVVRTNVQNQVFFDGDTTNNISFWNTSTTDSLRVYAGAVDIQANIFTLNKQHLVTAIITGSNSIIAVDNDVRTGLNLGTNIRNGITIGSHGDLISVGNAFTGNFQELVVYETNQSSSRSLIENNINNYYSIYTSSNAGYVARWYDQSGNNNHATQTTTARQPQIVTSGSVETQTSSGTVKPAIKFDNASGQFLSTSTINNVRSVFATLRRRIALTDYIFWLGAPTDTDDYHPGNGLNPTWLSSFSSNAGVKNGSNKVNGVLQNLLSTSQVDALVNLSLINSASITSRVQGIGAGNNNNQASRCWDGHWSELTIYTSSQTANREPIEYGINNYYNIYPQTSSFTTSSFAIYATSGSVSASLNNDLVSGISSTGPLGFITVSRTGSNSLTIARNGVTSSFAVPASGALSTGIYLGAINNNGLALANSPLNLSFASIGTGLNNTEIVTYGSLVNALQYGLMRNIDSDYLSILNYATSSGYTLPSTRTQAAQNALLIDLKAAGIWNKLDVFYVFASDGDVNFATLNWKNLTSNKVTGQDSLVPNAGIYIKTTNNVFTNFNPTSGVNYKALNASRYIYVYSFTAGNQLDGSGGLSNGNRMIYANSADQYINNIGPTSAINLAGTRSLKSYHITGSSLFFSNGNTTGSRSYSGTPSVVDANQSIFNSGGGYSNGIPSMYAMGASMINENPSFISAFDLYMSRIS